jgi:hypothetical protein
MMFDAAGIYQGTCGGGASQVQCCVGQRCELYTRLLWQAAPPAPGVRQSPWCATLVQEKWLGIQT